MCGMHPFPSVVKNSSLFRIFFVSESFWLLLKHCFHCCQLSRNNSG